uniref:BTB domain-containing protein n=1 Tax=Panagrolaimus davidi TaxID=227884 RepID=A0A914QM69_9BILA
MRIAYPFSVEWRIKEDELAALKTSEDDDRIESDVFFLSFDDPSIYYFLTIFPNGNCYETRGKACIFSHAPFGSEAILKFSIESANYSYIMQYLYNNENIVRGTFPCTTEELFKAEMKFIVNGEMVVKVNGTLWIEKEKEPTIMALEKGIVQKGYHRGRNFTFVIGEKFIKVHKHVLQRASPFFVEFFNSDMKEVKEKKMIIFDFDFEIVHAAMKLLYSASIPTTFTFEQMLSLLHFSNKYDIGLIKDRVQDYLINKISSTNVCSILLFTKTTVSSKQLQQKCIDFIIKKLGENQTVFGLETLDEEVMMKILLSINTRSA